MSDPCQCLFDHETAMRRLISWLRDNQDSTSADPDSLSGNPTGMGGNQLMMWTMLWGLLAVVMYLMRPNSLRQQPRDAVAEKPAPSNNDNDNGPPPPGLT